MNRRTALTVALAALALVAVALAAATLDSATASQGGGLGLGSTDQAGAGDGETGPIGASDGGLMEFQSAQTQVCVPFLTRPPVLFAIVGAFLLLGYVIYNETGTVFVPAAVIMAFGIPVTLVHALLTNCGPPPESDGRSLVPPLPFDGNGSSLLPSGAGSTGVADAAGQVTTPTMLLGIVLLAALAGSVLLLLISTGDDEEVLPDEEPEPPAETDVAAVGRAAGEAADRIEADADVDNEVFRAWREMTDHVAVSRPSSSTPGEFAAAAVDAGMDREDVTELTSLFEDVRYGGEAPTPEHEERAVAALRRIEVAYADGDEGSSEAAGDGGDADDVGGAGDPSDDGTDHSGGTDR
ncbi:DUF4129 domain-containing protein [Halobium salinum]|uniref:DUF4129 domain-containing protein n=1 Tax=Halobium salinum TaxID=1364940 RepID=A0ABD5PD90_9EURY|nr:DUF4129 domain-containing protein [Halobium salinum]